MLSKKILFFFRARYAFSLLLFLVIVNGCGSRKPLNLSIAKERIKKYYESGQYDRDFRKVVHRAQRCFKYVSTSHNATIIFDVDETVLSGYADEKSISFGYVPKLSHEWVLQADAPAIRSMKQLYDYLVDRGFIIIFLTGRKHNEYSATLKNLREQGFAKFEKLIVRQKSEEKMTAQEYKAARRKELTRMGYRIVGCLGDQWSDLKGGFCGHRFKLPNVRYVIN